MRDAATAHGGIRWPQLEKVTLEDGEVGWVVHNAPPRTGGGWALEEGCLLVQRADVGVCDWRALRRVGRSRWNGVISRFPGSIVEHLRAMEVAGRSSQARAALNRFPIANPFDLPPCALVLRDVQDAELRAGDLILIHGRRDCDLVRGRAWPVPREWQEPMRAAHLEREAFKNLTPWADYYQRGGFLSEITNRVHWGRRAKVWKPQLKVWRAWDTAVSAPIAASSDEVALFELIHQVGGRMPAREEV